MARYVPHPSWRTDPLVLSAVFILFASAVFLAFPAIDIAVSRYFYDPAQGGFYLAKSEALIVLRRSSGIFIVGICAAVIVSLIGKLARPELPSLITPRASILFVSTLALGPGLVVNLVFKNNWGRPRPGQVELFGGTAPYVDVWRISEYCARNCSFVSGEGSSALWLMTVVLLAPARWRAPLGVLVGLYALALSVNRIAFGGHFLSDVLLSWGMTALIIAVVYRLLYVDNPPGLTDENLDAGLARAGRSLRRR
jgi:membrane-associated PAP2 superfamily phosphatase